MTIIPITIRPADPDMIPIHFKSDLIFSDTVPKYLTVEWGALGQGVVEGELRGR